jgi:periplasmic copper chaperone A
MKKFAFLTFALLFGLVSMPALASGIQVEGAWIRAAPPSVKILAAYMTIKNSSNTSKTVVGAHSPQFAKVEFHESLIRNGMATMIARDSLAISAGGEVVLSPGGYHMMLIGPQRMIKKGDKIAINLHFSDGSSHKVIANVMKTKGKTMDHSKMNHSKMNHGKMNHNKNMMQHQMMNPTPDMMHQKMMRQQQMMQQRQNMMQQHRMNHNPAMMMQHHTMNHNPGMMGSKGLKKGASCPMMQHKKGAQCQNMHKQKDGSCGICIKNGKMKHENCMCMKNGMMKHDKMKHKNCMCIKNGNMKKEDSGDKVENKKMDMDHEKPKMDHDMMQKEDSSEGQEQMEHNKMNHENMDIGHAPMKD